MKNAFLVLTAITLFGCGDFMEDLEWCSVESPRYKQTEFDCSSYSIAYVVCRNQQSTNHGECIRADTVPEMNMGHCTQRNICYGKK